MNDLKKYFINNKDREIFKVENYFDIYDKYFSRFRGVDVHLMEFGVSYGGSLQMWKSYFGEKSKIYGVDINPYCKQVEEKQIKVFIGDQQDKRFLQSLIEAVPKIDILIDDGGHTMNQQINTFRMMYSHLDKEGIYICEDIHSSYLKQFGGGYRKRGTFIEYSKSFIDCIQHCNSKDLSSKKIGISNFAESTYALHYYDGMVVIEKRPVRVPRSIRTGHVRLNRNYLVTIEELSFLRRLNRWLQYPLNRKILGLSVRWSKWTLSERIIKEFKFAASENPELPSDIRATMGDKYIQIDVPSGIDITSLKPTIIVSEGAKVSPESGTAIDFTNQVTYTVTAKNGLRKNYKVYFGFIQ